MIFLGKKQTDGLGVDRCAQRNAAVPRLRVDADVLGLHWPREEPLHHRVIVPVPFRVWGSEFGVGSWNDHRIEVFVGFGVWGSGIRVSGFGGGEPLHHRVIVPVFAFDEFC